MLTAAAAAEMLGNSGSWPKCCPPAWTSVIDRVQYDRQKGREVTQRAIWTDTVRSMHRFSADALGPERVHRAGEGMLIAPLNVDEHVGASPA